MHCVIKMKKEGNQLVLLTKRQGVDMERFKASLSEGDVTEVYFELLTDNGSLGQLAKLHAMIRELAQHTGNTFTGMKLLVKKRSGLFTIMNDGEDNLMYCKSFGDDCSKEELSLAIHTCYEIGIELDHPLN